jgi:hypothetical protein
LPQIQSTPVPIFGLSAGSINGIGTHTSVTNLAYAQANHSATGSYTVLAQVGEVTFSNLQPIASFSEARQPFARQQLPALLILQSLGNSSSTVISLITVVFS